MSIGKDTPAQTVRDIIAAHADGMKAREISELTGVPINTIYGVWNKPPKGHPVKKALEPLIQPVRSPTTTEILDAIRKAIVAKEELEKLKLDYAKVMQENIQLKAASARLVREALAPLELTIDNEQQRQQIEERRT